MILLGEAEGSRLELQRFAAALGLAGSAGIGQPVSIEPRARARARRAGGSSSTSPTPTASSAPIAGGFGIDANMDLTALWSPSYGPADRGQRRHRDRHPHAHLARPDRDHHPVRAGQHRRRPAATSADPDRAVRRVLRQPRRRCRRPSTGSVCIARMTFPPERRQPRPARPRLRVQAAERRRPRVDAGVVRAAATSTSTPNAASTPASLELDIAEFLSVKAIGLITTRMPDGSKGFSLLIIITAEFGTGHPARASASRCSASAACSGSTAR